MSRFLRFSAIGSIGFIVDAIALLSLLRWIPVDPFSARLVSIAIALSVTWLLNRFITFGPSSRHVAVEGARYGGIGFASAAINYVAYSLLLVLLPSMPVIVALAIASAMAMTFSFLGYSRLVFDR